MKILTAVLLSLFIINAISNATDNKETRIKIAVIDTGVNLSDHLKPYICLNSNKSTLWSSAFLDSNGHGTNVAGLIADEIDKKKYCILIIKIAPYIGYEIEALNYANEQNARFINLSLGGVAEDALERETLKTLLNNGVHITVAAGNSSTDLDKKCNFYPACYANEFKSNNFHVVGAKSYTVDFRYSNYGSIVKYTEDADYVGTPPLRGTSQAAAIHTGKWAGGKF